MNNIIQTLRSPFSFTLGGIHIGPGPLYMVLPILLVVSVLFIGSLIWIYRDAQKRQKHGWLAVIFATVVFWPCSLILWLWLRPKKAGNIGHQIWVNRGQTRLAEPANHRQPVVAGFWGAREGREGGKRKNHFISGWIPKLHPALA